MRRRRCGRPAAAERAARVRRRRRRGAPRAAATVFGAARQRAAAHVGLRVRLPRRDRAVLEPVRAVVLRLHGAQAVLRRRCRHRRAA
eukprot:6373390-Prymnesium_polylepis.1